MPQTPYRSRRNRRSPDPNNYNKLPDAAFYRFDPDIGDNTKGILTASVDFSLNGVPDIIGANGGTWTVVSATQLNPRQIEITADDAIGATEFVFVQSPNPACSAGPNTVWQQSCLAPFPIA